MGKDTEGAIGVILTLVAIGLWFSSKKKWVKVLADMIGFLGALLLWDSHVFFDSDSSWFDL